MLVSCHTIPYSAQKVDLFLCPTQLNNLLFTKAPTVAAGKWKLKPEIEPGETWLLWMKWLFAEKIQIRKESTPPFPFIFSASIMHFNSIHLCISNQAAPWMFFLQSSTCQPITEWKTHVVRREVDARGLPICVPPPGSRNGQVRKKREEVKEANHSEGLGALGRKRTRLSQKVSSLLLLCSFNGAEWNAHLLCRVVSWFSSQSVLSIQCVSTELIPALHASSTAKNKTLCLLLPKIQRLYSSRQQQSLKNLNMPHYF